MLASPITVNHIANNRIGAAKQLRAPSQVTPRNSITDASAMDRRTINLCRRNDRDFKGTVLAEHLQELRVAPPALPKLARVSDDNLLGTTLIQQHALHKGIRGHRSNL